MSSVSNDLIQGTSWEGFPPLPDKFDFSPFPSTIPVVDLSKFQNPDTKREFVADILRAMKEVGFFAVVNTGMNEEALNSAYDASRTFFEAAQKHKDEICKPELNGQRGYVPSEVAQEATRKDYKEFVHIGRNNNLWPVWMDLQTPMETLIARLDEHSEILQRAFAIAIGKEEEFFINMTKEGECLLRMLHYPRTDDPNAVGASKHTDIDLFTILPMATEEGLQIWHNDEWIDVKVPPGAFIVNVGDKLQNLTNGLFKSSVHQVIVKPNVERYSIVYFVHPRDNDPMGPTPNAVALTGGVTRYPEGTSLELLAVRLREIALADPNLKKFERECGIRERIAALVETGNAAEPVKLTHSLLMKNFTEE